MEDFRKIKNIIEALLMISENGLSKQEIKDAMIDVDGKDIAKGVEMLVEEYTSSGRSFNISEIAGKYRIVTNPEYMPWITNLYEKKSDRLTGPSLETLAIIAYKQPVTRAEIESIRGVNVGGLLKTVLDKDLIQIKGRKNVVGKPLIYGTTDKFLEIFGLNALDELPALKEIREEDLEYGKTNKNMIVENIANDSVKEEEKTEEASQENNSDVLDPEVEVEKIESEGDFSDEIPVNEEPQLKEINEKKDL